MPVIERTRPGRLDFLIKAPAGQLWRAFWVASGLGMTGLMFNTNFGLFLDSAETRCMPERLYMGYPLWREIRQGDVVSFKADNQMMFDLMTGKRITKIVAARQGDHVRSDSSGVFINDERVAVRHHNSLENLALKGNDPININRELLKGEVFVLGVLPRSFDSRYWGPMPEGRIDRLVKPLL
jgi:conjugal transfer pilin signal peptidase TrbI